LRAHLAALNLEETRGYVHRRLQLAGNKNPAELFPVEAIAEVHRQSRGFPRLINTLCEGALIHGYAKQACSVTPEMIEEIASNFRLNVIHPSKDRNKNDGHSREIEKAARTLLDLYAHLREARESSADIRMTTTGGVKHEPYF